MTDIWSTMLDRRLSETTPWAPRSSGMQPLSTPNEFNAAVQEVVDNFIANLPTSEQIERSAQLNDQARETLEDCCTVVVSDAFASLPQADRHAIRLAVSVYDHSAAEYGTDSARDFGVIYQHWDGNWSPVRPFADNMREIAFWTIDCLESTLARPALRPWDSRTTTRVLTLTLASEK